MNKKIKLEKRLFWSFASVEDAEILWQRRHYLSDLPEALPLVLSAVNDWSIAFLPSIYELSAFRTNQSKLMFSLFLPKVHFGFCVFYRFCFFPPHTDFFVEQMHDLLFNSIHHFTLHLCSNMANFEGRDSFFPIYLKRLSENQICFAKNSQSEFLIASRR